MEKSHVTPFRRPGCTRNLLYSRGHRQSNRLYAATVTALNGYFLPKVNSAFARQKFHRLQQKEGETVLQFVPPLRKEGKDCNFGADFETSYETLSCKNVGQTM